MISKIEIQGFRGIPGSLEIDFGRITLLTGRNGLGKTTVFDAIDWCLFGNFWRLGDQASALRNLYNQSSNPKVTIALQLGGETATVERTEECVKLNGNRLSDSDFLAHIVTDVDIFEPYARDVAERVRRTVYLPQAEIRTIVGPESGAEREAIFQGLLGVPNAALLQSSTRRVQERLSQRRRETEEERDKLEERIRQLSNTPSGGESDDDRRNRQVVARAAGLLRTHNTDTTSANELLSLARTQIQSTAVERAKLEGFQAFLSDLEQSLQKARLQLRDSDEGVVLLSRQLSEIDNELRENTLTRDERAKDVASSEQRLAEAIAAVNQLRLIRTKLQEFQKAVELRNFVQSQEQMVADAKALTEEARERLLTARTSLDRELASLTQAQERQRKMEELDSVTVRMEGTTHRFNAVEGRCRELAAVLVKTEAELLLVQTGFDEIERERQSAIRAASARDRLRALLSQAAILVEELRLTICPLCGQDFHEQQALLSHVNAAAIFQPEDNQQIASLTNRREAQQTLVAQTRDQLEAIKTSLKQAENERAQLWKDLEELRQRKVTLTETKVPVIPDSMEALQSKIRNRQEELHSAEQSVAQLQSRFEAAEANLISSREALLAVEARLVPQVSFVDDRKNSVEAIEQQLQKAEQLKSELQEAKKRAEDAHQVQAAFCQQLSNRRGGIGTAFDEARARLTQARQNLASLNDQLRSQASAVFLNPDSEQLGADVSYKLADISKHEASLREVINELEAIASAEHHKATALEMAGFQVRHGKIQNDLDRMSRTQTRMTELSAAVQRVRSSEAGKAMRQLREAIQECFAALYPHSHLDEVKLSGSDILLYDPDVAEPVQPYLYVSTGQLNVLALSFFMGLALRQRLSRLGFVMLDEPVQNLADVHFLAFMAFIKRVAPVKQVILSTADSNIAELFRRQMISTAWFKQAEQYFQYEWKSFDPWQGPEVAAIDASQESSRSLNQSASLSKHASEN